MKNKSVSVWIIVAAIVAGSLGCQKESSPSPSSSTASQGPKPTVSSNAWQVPVDVLPSSPTPTPTPTQNDWLNFGWQTFVALDWPTLSPNSGGAMAQPDTSSMIGATAPNGALVPAVWNTYRDVSTIMLANGVDPGQAYSQPTKIPSSCPALGSSNPVAPGFTPLYIDNSTFPQATLPKSYTNEAFTGPLIDQEGWFTLEQIFVDPSEYAYIQGNQYFQGAIQAATYQKNGQLAPFPRTGQEVSLPSYAQYGALEVKTTWRVLDPAKDQSVIPRYYRQWGYFMQADGKTCEGPVLFGLIGLHILRLTPSTASTWFWASFEQVDNTMPPSGIPATLAAPNTPNGNCTSQYNVKPKPVSGNIPWNSGNTANNICQVTLIPSNVQQVNQNWQGQLQGTVWQYYQMVNTLNPYSPGDTTPYPFPPLNSSADPINLNIYANTAIESYFQSTTTCMTCHGHAAGDGVPSPFTGTNQIFTFVLQNAYWSNAGAAKATQDRLFRLFRTADQAKLAPALKAKPGGKSKK